MGSNQPIDSSQPDSPGGRLDSWKEIAAHLRRDVRTVQRWHRRAGLPVHRHVDARQRGVFAFQSELDAWANRSRARFEEAQPPEDEHKSDRGRSLTVAWALAAVVVLCAVTALVAWPLRRGPSRPAPSRSPDRPWVLVAAFDNHSGDETLDESLQFVLERELAASRVVSVVPRSRVEDLLRLMRRPPATRVTPAVARELALRDGNIPAVVTGRIDREATGYLLTVDIVDSQKGATISSRSTEVAARPRLPGGVRLLAGWARDALDETSPASPRAASLPQVTTTSLPALQFFAKAEDALAQNDQQAARVLLESALREDPEFAMAHSWLALVLENEPDVRAVGPLIAEHADRALALSGHTTERERLHIVGTYQMEHGDEKALATWEALVRIDPDNWLAHHYLSGLYYRLRRIPEALREAERAAQLRPDDFRIAASTAQSWVLWADEPARARPYVERARTLWPAQSIRFASETRRANLPPEHARAAAWVLLFSAYERWRAGDVQGMLREVQQVLDSNPLPAPVDRDALLTIAIAFDMSAGRLHEARALADRLFQERLRQLHLAVLADVVDDQSALRRYMRGVPLDGEERPLRFVRAGLYREAEYVMARTKSHEGYTETARGELALRRGELSEAVKDLQRGVDLASAHTLSERYLGAESLASALERLNRDDDAIKVLESAAAAEPRYTRTGPSAAFWLRVLGRLSLKYRNMGRTADADALDARLRRLLVAADPDHPLVVQLARRSPARGPVEDHASK